MTDTKKLCMIGLFSAVRGGDGQSITLSSAFIVVLLDHEGGPLDRESMVHLELVDPDGRQVFGFEAVVNFDQTGYHRGQIQVIIEVSPLKFTVFGDHEIRVRVNGKLEKTLAIMVGRHEEGT
jgi:hypothetical protein